jgi:hypothetical protein
MKSGQIERAKEAIRWISNEESVLEFGCGRGELAKHMNALGYMWASTEFVPIECLRYLRNATTVSIDVMEHTAESGLDRFLSTLLPFANKHVWAIANMSDVHDVNGEQVELHTIQQPAEWWIDRIRRYWPGKITHEVINCDRFLLVMERE